MKQSFKKVSLASKVIPIVASLGIGFAANESIHSFQHHSFIPVSDFKIERNAYDLVYDGQHRQAKWVHEYLTQDKLNQKIKKSKQSFHPDPSIPKSLRANPSDYKGSGFDQGHLCPAADAKYSDRAFDETFYLSNVSPQVPGFNRGIWKKLEQRIRTLVATYQKMHVFTLPLYLSYQKKDGKRYVKYQVIGKDEVAVPNAFAKMIFDDHWNPIEMYILPHESIGKDVSLDQFKTTPEKVAQCAGLIFENMKSR